MKIHEQEKHELERTAIQLFISIYNQNHQEQLRLLYQQERPDAVLQINNHKKLGLEITHIFYDPIEARMLLGREDEPIFEIESIENLIIKLNILLTQKEQKIDFYSKDYPIALLIRNASPVFGMSSLLQAKEQIIHNSSSKFTNIWLLSRDNGQDWLLIDLLTDL